jgi:hypothetical protein
MTARGNGAAAAAIGAEAHTRATTHVGADVPAVSQGEQVAIRAYARHDCDILAQGLI